MVTYHAGELEVHARVGVQAEAQSLGSGIGAIVKPTAQKFLHSQQLAIASTVDSSGRVWASLLTGQPGFVQTIDERTVQIAARPVSSDPLNQNLLISDQIGLLIIDLGSRRRLRINGKVIEHSDRGLLIHPNQSYFNCPKYIQLRYIKTEVSQQRAQPTIQSFETLTKGQQHWITQADTFFIASFHPEGGADASHRGGYPGFVQVVDANKLVFPDYSGNNMFNTLGNLVVNPNAGLLFIDFERGNTLQLTGKAHIIWDGDRLSEFAGAERLVEFHTDQVLETTNATQLRWQFGDYSPANPAFGNEVSPSTLVCYMPVKRGGIKT